MAWLKKALQRAKEQALDENRSLEEVAAERWGVSKLSSLYNYFFFVFLLVQDRLFHTTLLHILI